jgi:hypothetical protein
MNQPKNYDHPGKDFTGMQKAIDDAINETLKNERGTQKLDPATANNPAKRSRKTDVTSKKTSGGKQTNRGM